MKKLFILLLNAMISFPALVLAQNHTVIQFIPFSGEGTIECTGETLHLEGQYIWVGHSTLGSINYSGSYAIHLQGISGTNLITGEKYIYAGTMKNRVNFSFHNGRRVVSNILEINLIGTGKATSLTMHNVISSTYDANGQLRAEIDEMRLECR